MPLTRRSFLAAAGVLAAPQTLTAAPAPEIDVAIIGAGAAGIAAARRIAAAGRHCVVLEAKNEVGGRCVTDTRTFGVPFDRGAHWIHRPASNPVAKLAPQTGLEVYRAPFGQRVRIGRRNARDSELEDYLAAAVRANRAIADAARGRADVDCAKVLPDDLGDWRSTIEFTLGPYAFGRDLAELSAVDVSRSAERDVDAFCRQGFGALLAKLAAGLPVRLSSPVTRIDWSGRGGHIELRAGDDTVRAAHAIVTASTGVLAAGKIEFTPELPRGQADAFGALRLGSYDHIALELSGNPLQLARDDLVFEKSSGPSTAALLANISDTHLATIDVGGRFGRELAGKGERAMIAFAIDWLVNLYGAELRDAVKRTAATRWDQDPWTLGAMSGAAPGRQGARRALAEPVRERLHFAGEAAHETLWGTVGGAWESGERAAEAVLRRLAPPKAAVAEKTKRKTKRR
jgi:monoamine oxidase